MRRRQPVFGWAFVIEGVLPALLREPHLGWRLPVSAVRSTLSPGWTHDEVAAFVVFLLSDEAAFVAGAALAIDGGFTAQ
jgi:NAD(P)-dependent dehydrogenase (short-subunit alcohol dehydrogenase family)